MYVFFLVSPANFLIIHSSDHYAIHDCHYKS